MKHKHYNIKLKILELVKEYYRSKFSIKESKNVPVSGKVFDENELMLGVQAVLEGQWTEGKFTKIFENKLNDFLSINNTVVVNSGSSANLIALKTLTSEKLGERKLKQGDEVITVAASFPTTVNPIVECGCIPVFCDIDIGTYSININQLKKAISSRTKAIFVAHTLGNPFNLEEILKICKKHKLWLIEDNCDALGSRYKGSFTGTFGDLSTISFYPAHHITMGEGGAVCTNSRQLAKIARSIRDWGRDCWCIPGVSNTCKKRFEWKLGDLPYGYDHKYTYSELGYNLKNTDLNVAIGIAQIEKLPKFITQRKNNFKSLLDGLKKYEEYFYLPQAQEHSDPSWFGFIITLKENCPFTRLELIDYLNKHQISTRLLFAGNIIKQPYFIDRKIEYRLADILKNTDLIMNNTFWIGVYPGITKRMIQKVLGAFNLFVKDKRKK